MKQITKEIFSVLSFNDILELSKKYDRTTKIKFKCTSCGKEYLGTIRYTLKKGNLCCKQCKIDESKIERYGSKTYNNSKKAQETNLKNLGVSSPFKQDWVRRYNAEACKSEERRKKISESLKSHNEDFWRDLQKKKEETIIKKYGSLENYQKKKYEGFKKTCLEKYGIENIGALNAEKEYSSLQKYFYDGRFFDSSYELKYYIWLKDHNIEFEFHNKTYFRYKRQDGSTHRYYPDFYVNGQYIEIKGEFWWNSEKECLINKDGDFDYEKTACMKEHGVVLKTKKDLVEEFTYVDMTYGKDFVKQLKYSKR